MSRIQNYSVSAYPSTYDTTNSSVNGAENTDYGCTSSASTTYAVFRSKKNESRKYYYNIATNIPNNAVISGVECYVRAHAGGTGPNYMAYAQLCHGLTEKGTETELNGVDTGHSFSLSTGTWDRSEVDEIKIKLTPNRNANNRQLHFYGANLIINYSITYYSISVSSLTQNISIITSEAEVESGGSATVTTNASDLNAVIIKDNGTDITSNFTGTSGNFSYVLSSINEDHSFTIEQKAAPSNILYLKGNSQWMAVQKAYKKISGRWIEQTDLANVFTDGNVYVAN